MTKEKYPRKEAYGTLREFIIHVDYFEKLKENLNQETGNLGNIIPNYNPNKYISSQKIEPKKDTLVEFTNYISKNRAEYFNKEALELRETFLCFQLTFYELPLFIGEMEEHFEKEYQALFLIQENLEETVRKDGSFNYLKNRESVLKFYHLYRLKKFTYDWYSHIALEASVIDTNTHKTTHLIDKILWWIPELKGKYNAQFVSEGVRDYKMELKRSAGKTLTIVLHQQCKDNGFIDGPHIHFKKIFNQTGGLDIGEKRVIIDKLCSKEGYLIQLEHPLDRHIAKCYIENLCVEISKDYPVHKESDNENIRNKIIKAVDKLSVVFFGCLVTKTEHKNLGKSSELIVLEKQIIADFGDETPKKDGEEKHKKLYKKIETMKTDLKATKNEEKTDNELLSKYIENPLFQYDKVGISVYYIDDKQKYIKVKKSSNVIDLIEPTYHPKKLIIDNALWEWEKIEEEPWKWNCKSGCSE